MIKIALLLLVLLLDYLGYRYGKSQLAVQQEVRKLKGKSMKKTWAEKKAQLQERTQQLEREMKEEEEEDLDDFIDKESFNFLLIGLVATFLFLIIGMFTGNPLYFYLLIFLITTLVYLFHNKVQ